MREFSIKACGIGDGLTHAQQIIRRITKSNDRQPVSHVLQKVQH